MRKFGLAVLAVLLVGLLGLGSEPGKLIIWCDETRAPVMQDLAQQFTEKYGVPVEVQEVGFGDIRDRLGIAGPAGEGPDILIGAHDWLGQLVANGLLEPLEFMSDIKDQFVPVAVEAFSYGETIYGLPYATEAIALIYNKDLVPEPPATFEELIEIAKELTDPEAGQYGFLANIPQPDPYHSFPFISAYGGYIFGKSLDGTLNPCDIGLDKIGALQGVKLILKLIDEGILPADCDYATMTGLFNEGKAGMILTGPWAIGDARKAGINFGVAKIPPMDGNTPRPFVGVQGFMVSAFSENKALAKVFLEEFIANKDTMLALYERDPRNPAYLPALDEVASDPIVQAFAASAADGVPMPSIPQMSAVWGAWADALLLIVTGQQDPESALKDAVARIRETIGCPGL